MSAGDSHNIFDSEKVQRPAPEIFYRYNCGPRLHQRVNKQKAYTSAERAIKIQRVPEIIRSYPIAPKPMQKNVNHFSFITSGITLKALIFTAKY